MEVKHLLGEIDAEIGRLQSARASLLALSSSTTPKRGRPKGSTAAAALAAPARKPRKLSAEGRKRIAEAQKRRWAEKNKVAGSK
jgi:hypothetical protein